MNAIFLKDALYLRGRMRLQDYGERRGIFAVCLAVVALIARCSSSPDYSGCEGLESIGDGCCDMDNNNAECGK